MEILLGEATKLLDNFMANYSQWHTERSSTSKKAHAIEEINALSGKRWMNLWNWFLARVLLFILMICLCLLWLSKIVMPLMWILSLEIISTRMLIEVILILGLFWNSFNNYGNSYGDSSYNNNRKPSVLESNIK